MISNNIDKYRAAIKLHFSAIKARSICCKGVFFDFFDIDGAEEETRIAMPFLYFPCNML